MTARSLTGYLVTAPGLEALTLREAERLGLACGEAEPGGIEFSGTLSDIARANLWLRTASRVLVRMSSFTVRALGELERKAALIDWGSWLPPGVPLQLRVSSRKSRLYHQKAIAERIGNALLKGGHVLAQKAGPNPGDEDDGGDSSQLIVVRLLRDECSISLDSSGALLHRRGYRQAVAKAPLRETLAAALLETSGWEGSAPLLDPFCGSGTIPIEAALIARRIAPGRHRAFACQRWPGWDAPAWKALLADADGQALPSVAATIIGSDRDAGAITAAKANAERAGVAPDIEFRQHAVSELRAPAGTGWLISNPPYGVRIGDAGAMKALYGRFGEVARTQLAGWQLLMLLPEQLLERPTGLSWTEAFRTNNGGLLVRAVRAQSAK
jgi:putative N6-adenine-specific DNA methylase